MLASFHSRGSEHEEIELLKSSARGVDMELAMGLSSVIGILSGPDDDLEFHDLTKSFEIENDILSAEERGGTE